MAMLLLDQYQWVGTITIPAIDPLEKSAMSVPVNVSVPVWSMLQYVVHP